MAKRASRALWEDPSTQLNPDAPAVTRILKRERWKRVALTVIAFAVVPLTALVAFSSISSSGNQHSAATAEGTSTRVNDSTGKGAAVAAMNEWLASTPSPLPDAKILSWNGYTVEEPPAATTDSEKQSTPTYRFETHQFTLERGTDLYAASLQIAVDGVATTVIATPTVTPIVTVPITGDVTAWFGAKSVSAPSAVQDAVTNWATAFTSGDPIALRMAVQDKDPAHGYVPLHGVTSIAQLQITDAAMVPAPNDKNPTQMVVRAQMSLTWDGQAPLIKEGSTQPAVAQPITYDLLVDDPSSASPHVVAWGPSGSGLTLKAFGNALSGVTVDKPASTPAPSPTSTGGSR